MRPTRIVFAVAVLSAVAAVAAPAGAQEPPLPPLAVATACAPPPTTNAPDDVLHVVGSQDTVARGLLGRSDLIVVDGGTAKGVQLGQRYFVRSSSRLGSGFAGAFGPQPVRTAGWIRIVAVNDTTAIATAEHLCGTAVATGDYLEPFVAPEVPEGADRTDTSGTPDFTAAGRVLFGDRDRSIGGPGEFMLIDRGTDQGVTAGTRFAVYRDVEANQVKALRPTADIHLPLTRVGEAMAVEIGRSMSLVRIIETRDAVMSGDLVVPRAAAPR